MCTVLFPSGDNPVAVNKYAMSYYITSNRPKMRCCLSPFSLFRLLFPPKMLLKKTFILVTHINYNTMLNSYFKPIEQFTHTVRAATCCPGLLSACGSLRLRCECLHMNPQYHFFPAVSILILCIKKPLQRFQNTIRRRRNQKNDKEIPSKPHRTFKRTSEPTTRHPRGQKKTTPTVAHRCFKIKDNNY